MESIHALINSVQRGDRELREQATTPYEYSRLDEFYDMVATTDSESKLTVERVLESQKKDPFCSAMVEYLEDGSIKLGVEGDSDYDDEEEETTSKKPTKAAAQKRSRAAEEIVRSAPYFSVTDSGVLTQLKQRKAKAKSRSAKELDCLQQVYIPQNDKQLQHDLVDAVHHEAGHIGAVKTYQMLLQRFHWIGMYTSVHQRIQACAKCQFYSVKAAKAPFLGHTHAIRCGQKIALDIIRLPETNGCEYVLTAVDVFSRYAFLAPCRVGFESIDDLESAQRKDTAAWHGKTRDIPGRRKI